LLPLTNRTLFAFVIRKAKDVFAQRCEASCSARWSACSRASIQRGALCFNARLGMRKALISTFLVLFFSICAVTELRASPDSDRDEPFDMGKLDLARFAPRRGPTWREWRKIIANVEAEMRELAKCRTEPDRCNAAERRFETIVKKARSKNGRAKIEFVNERINGEIRYEPDTAQWGVEDAWSLPIDINKEGSLNTGVGDCEDYVLAKYAALHQAGCPTKTCAWC
jgi:predicted transglutaminase-like cysteine proteinase